MEVVRAGVWVLIWGMLETLLHGWNVKLGNALKLFWGAGSHVIEATY